MGLTAVLTDLRREAGTSPVSYALPCDAGSASKLPEISPSKQGIDNLSRAWGNLAGLFEPTPQGKRWWPAGVAAQAPTEERIAVRPKT